MSSEVSFLCASGPSTVLARQPVIKDAPASLWIPRAVSRLERLLVDEGGWSLRIHVQREWALRRAELAALLSREVCGLPPGPSTAFRLGPRERGLRGVGPSAEAAAGAAIKHWLCPWDAASAMGFTEERWRQLITGHLMVLGAGELQRMEAELAAAEVWRARAWRQQLGWGFPSRR